MERDDASCWSVAPDQTWIELNRAITYVIVLCLAIALGASDRSSGQMDRRMDFSPSPLL